METMALQSANRQAATVSKLAKGPKSLAMDPIEPG
jgi:hypothetical protein